MLYKSSFVSSLRIRAELCARMQSVRGKISLPH